MAMDTLERAHSSRSGVVMEAQSRGSSKTKQNKTKQNNTVGAEWQKRTYSKKKSHPRFHLATYN